MAKCFQIKVLFYQDSKRGDALKYINLENNKQEEIVFVGKGSVDSKDIEINFKVMVGDIRVEKDDWDNCKITMFPAMNENLNYLTIKESKEEIKLKEQINNNFKYHPPKGNQVEKYETLRREAKTLAHLIADICPNSREKSLAVTNLEQAVMWANAAIARNE